MTAHALLYSVTARFERLSTPQVSMFQRTKYRWCFGLPAADALDAKHAGVGVAIYNAFAAAIGGFLGPFIVGAFVQRMGTFVSSMVAMGAFLCWAGVMMVALGIYMQVDKRRKRKIPAARDGSDAVTSTTDLLQGLEKDAACSAGADVELADIPIRSGRSRFRM
jgi:hypothetical protein